MPPPSTGPAPDAAPAHPHFDDPPNAVHVHLLPALIDPAAVAGGVAVMIDCLRASTTIAAALAAGAPWVEPHLTVDGARAALAQHAPGAVLSGGERGGLRIDGFDLDNSPAAYTPARLAGRGVVFTTTNGTAALHRLRAAGAVYIGCFANLSALAARLQADARPIHLLCAGTRGEVTQEDALVAGAIAGRLRAAGRPFASGDQARIAALAFDACAAPAALRAAMHDSRGGRNLARLGLTADVDFCAGIDTLRIIPRWNPATNRITQA